MNDFYSLFSNHIDLDFYSEASSSPSYYIRDSIYKKVEDTLSKPANDKLFKRYVGEFIDRNSTKLHTAGPVYRIVFSDNDKSQFYKLFNVTEDEINVVMAQVTKSINENVEWRLLRNNPIFTLFFCVIRFYAIKKDDNGVRMALAIMALAMYPSMHSKYFKFQPNEAVMQYTMDNLTNKFTIKKSGHIFGALMESINQCYEFHSKCDPSRKIANGSDLACVAFIMRVRNSQNSFMKHIANEFMANHEKNLRVNIVTDVYDDNIALDLDNDSNKVETVTNKVVMQLITHGVDIRLADMAAKTAQVSINDIRNYLTLIVVDDNREELIRFIESIIFLYLYEGKRRVEDINSKAFLAFSLEIYRKGNSANPNIVNIKTTLDKWSSLVGIDKTFTRSATLINYRRAIYTFFVFAIQKYS